MTEAVAAIQQPEKIDDATMEALVVGGDMSRLTPAQRLQVYRARCDAAGLDPRVQPFEYIVLSGKLTLYARKAASDQLQSMHGAKVRILARETADDIYSTVIEMTLRDGRSTEEIGCVNVKGLAGDNLANARMKSLTKAKRRAILSLCGLGMIDESELDTVRGAQPAWEAPARTLEAVVQNATAQAQGPSEAPVEVKEHQGIPCVLGEPWEAWEGEKIGGANQSLMGLRWSDIVTTKDPSALVACERIMEDARRAVAKTGQPPGVRYQRMAMAWTKRALAATPEGPAGG